MTTEERLAQVARIDKRLKELDVEIKKKLRQGYKIPTLTMLNPKADFTQDEVNDIAKNNMR
jgi:biotin operon repressor